MKELVHVKRGTIIESRHMGHLAAVDSEGRIIASCGDPQHVTYARSSAKLLQAISVIELGAAERFKLTGQEIAIMCASHSGEPEHLRVVLSLLRKLDLDESFLQCGIHPPYHKASAAALQQNGEAPGVLHNNCSGKHSGMLALARQLEAPLDTYLSPEHPVQQIMLETVKDMAGLSGSELHIGVDGCGVPVFAMPIHRLARAFARLGNEKSTEGKRQSACQTIIGALRDHPFLLAGTDRFDTRLIEATDGKVIGKMGAEGVFAITVPAQGIGIAIKVADGSPRALYPTAVEALKQLGLLSEAEERELASFHKPDLTNWQGTKIGSVIPVFRIEKH